MERCKSCRVTSFQGTTPAITRLLPLKFGWLFSLAILTLFLLPTRAAIADDQASSWNRRAELKSAGYTELSGMEAVRFLIGNSVLVVQQSGAEDGKTGIARDRTVYYFLDDQTMSECKLIPAIACEVGSWSIKGNQICLVFGDCETSFAVLRAPNSEQWETHQGRLGIYLINDHFAYDIVKGNWSSGPSFKRHASGHPTELNRNDLSKEANDARGVLDGAIPIHGARAISLLIGNTFLSKDAAENLRLAGDACPTRGDYYSPSGIVIHFTCNGPPLNNWSIEITHWKIISGLLCRDEADTVGEFNCTQALVTAVPPPQGSSGNGKMLLVDGDGQTDDVRTSYDGNVFDFKFDVLGK